MIVRRSLFTSDPRHTSRAWGGVDDYDLQLTKLKVSTSVSGRAVMNVDVNVEPRLRLTGCA